MSVRPEHLFQGSDLNCLKCSLPIYLHRYRNRPEHTPQGDPCSLCQLPSEDHRIRGKRFRKRGIKPTYHRLQSTIKRRGNAKIRHDNRLFLGIDGEGQGKKDHKYVMLAVKSEDGEFQDYIQNPDGLPTKDCLEFILNIPDKTRIFAFAFSYDLTKILKDLPDEHLYFLMRPELRKRSKETDYMGPKPIFWEGFWLNIQGARFDVICADGRRKTIWDIWKFYQSRFTKALKLWKVGDQEEVKEIERMKDLRSEFDKKSLDEVLAYCLSECEKLGQLARKLVDAHEAAGLKLKNFYGAGSSAGAMLENMGIEGKIRDIPEAMRVPVYSAFFGGRFENSVIGTVTGNVYNHDISSAYPYQLCFLPCLEHGSWIHTTRRKEIERFKVALVRYKLPNVQAEQSWGPFPFRELGGSISFPKSSGGGWVWSEEYLAGERIFKNVQFVEAWGLFSHCTCRPFAQIPQYYRERIKLGKEGPGIVLKLGTNSVYGKLAQSVGRAMFNSWIWAGLVTSGCRAQILELMALHENLDNLLMVATDGIYTREILSLPLPRFTDTEDTRKPLGGWETKRYDKGIFAARPGIYFPIDADGESLDAIRARGLGKGVLLDNMTAIMEAWETRESDTQTFTLREMSRFCGAKSSISYSPKHDIYTRSERFGQWVNRPTVLSFNPMPKREKICSDGTLKIRELPEDVMSKPYDKAFKSKEASELGMLEMLIEEQPDLGFENYG